MVDVVTRDWPLTVSPWFVPFPAERWMTRSVMVSNHHGGGGAGEQALPESAGEGMGLYLNREPFLIHPRSADTRSRRPTRAF